jgi:propionate catabolism operon transcriptional regulator
MRELMAQGFRAFIGPSLIVSLAESLGATGVFVYSERSLRQALDDAIDLTALALEEDVRRRQLETILECIDHGVLGIDLQGMIRSMNRRMADMLGVSRDWAIGKPLHEAAPMLSLDSTLRTGRGFMHTTERIGSRTVIVSRVPVMAGARVSGAVLTCQEAGAVRRAEESIRRSSRAANTRARYGIDDLVGDSMPMQQLRMQARLWAGSDSTLLISGESGTGKEMLAQGIHRASSRHGGPFVAINCAAIPETLIESELFGHEEGAFTGARRGGRSGLIETAHQGTLFLDEVTEMPLPAQARLLRVLQEREVLRVGATEPVPVDIRVIAATNRDPLKMIAEGRFRADLFFRLNVLRLAVPPLRDRRQDIALIARRWLERTDRHAVAERWIDDHLEALRAYHWPGNVRELENVMERVVACTAAARELRSGPEVRSLTDLRVIAPELYPVSAEVGSEVAPAASARSDEPQQAEPVSWPVRRARLSDAAIIDALRRTGGRVERAAALLGVSRVTVWRRARALPAEVWTSPPAGSAIEPVGT